MRADGPIVMRTHLVFAYGSNMHLGDLGRWMGERGLGPPNVASVRPACLPGYGLVWNYRSPARRAGAANVAPLEGEAVPGLVLELDADTFAAIDAKEGHPGRYNRGDAPRPVSLLDGSGEVSAWVYRVTPAWERPPPVWPNPGYLALMLEAAEQWALPPSHLEALRAIPTDP